MTYSFLDLQPVCCSMPSSNSCFLTWRRKWQSTSVFLPGESHGWRSLVGYSPQGGKESDTTERLHLTSPHEPKSVDGLCAVCLVTQSYPTLCDHMDCSPPGSSVHGDSPGKNTGVGCYALLQGGLPSPGIKPRSPALEADTLTSEPPGKPK